MRLEKRTDIINFLVRRNGYGRYLEIGVRDASSNFDRIRVNHRESVDPAPRGDATHTMTSDEFFDGLDADRQYDIVMVDGLHIYDQVMRDVENSLAHLSDGGVVVLHDCNPPEEINQVEDYDGTSPWNGTVWKAIARLRMSRPDLAVCVVDTDWGVGVVTRGEQELVASVPDEQLTFDFLDRNRRELLNLVEPNEFPAVAERMFGEPAARPSLLDRVLRR